MTITFRSLILAVSVLCSVSLHAETIVITDRVQPVHNASNLRLILLDQPATLETTLSTNLPPDPRQAQAIVQQRLTPELADQITQAHQDVVTAWSLGITKIPAVVVDQEYVVYGEPDVQRALDLIARHREQQEVHP